MTGYSIFAGTLADMTYPEVEAAAAREATVLLPVGVIEQHGPHLPLATDVYGAYALCRLTAERLGDAAVVAPPMYWGVNHVSSAFAGSFRTRPETAAMLLEDMTTSLREDGFERVALVNHHGDLAHSRMLLSVVEGRHERGHTEVRLAATEEMIERLAGHGADGTWLRYAPRVDDIELSGELGVHAEEVETSLIAHWFPELVRFDVLEGLEPTGLGESALAEWRKGGEHARRITPDGYFGRPRPVNPDTWRRYERGATALAEAIRVWR